MSTLLLVMIRTERSMYYVDFLRLGAVLVSLLKQEFSYSKIQIDLMVCLLVSIGYNIVFHTYKL